jgi:hypothetical protein
MRARGGVLFLVLLTIALLACGSESNTTSDLSASAPSVVSQLTRPGWKANSVKGMPQTVSGAPQRLYLQTTAPDGTAIDIQFFAGAREADAERKAVVAKFKGFQATTVARAIAFSRGTGKQIVPATDLKALHRILESR